MDKIRKSIQIEQGLDRFNIQKSVVGTEEYYINQDIIKGVSQDEIIEKAKSGVYKLTAENKKAGRVGQKYGESKKEENNKLTVESIHNAMKGNNFWLEPNSKEAKIVEQATKEGYLRRTSHTQVEWKDQAAIDKLKQSESGEKKEWENLSSEEKEKITKEGNKWWSELSMNEQKEAISKHPFFSKMSSDYFGLHKTSIPQVYLNQK